MPIIAECGGFMYLHDALAIDDKHTYPMVGVIPGKAFPTAKLQRFGYVRLYAKENNLLCNKMKNCSRMSSITGTAKTAEAGSRLLRKVPVNSGIAYMRKRICTQDSPIYIFMQTYPRL